MGLPVFCFVGLFVVWGGFVVFVWWLVFLPFSIWCTRSSFIPRLSPSSWWAQHRSKKKRRTVRDHFRHPSSSQRKKVFLLPWCRTRRFGFFMQDFDHFGSRCVATNLKSVGQVTPSYSVVTGAMPNSDSDSGNVRFCKVVWTHCSCFWATSEQALCRCWMENILPTLEEWTWIRRLLRLPDIASFKSTAERVFQHFMHVWPRTFLCYLAVLFLFVVFDFVGFLLGMLVFFSFAFAEEVPLSEFSYEFIGPQKNWTAIPLGTAALGFRGHPREKTISFIPQRSSCFCFSEIASLSWQRIHVAIVPFIERMISFYWNWYFGFKTFRWIKLQKQHGVGFDFWRRHRSLNLHIGGSNSHIYCCFGSN